MTTNIASLTPCRDQYSELLDEMLCLKERILSETEKEMAGLAAGNVAVERMSSILNLLNYIVMRRKDLRPLQARLAAMGLSSLGRGEPHVLTNIDRVIDILSRAVFHRPYEGWSAGSGVDYETRHPLLRQRAENIFGNVPLGRTEYIMVTMPTEAASNVELVKSLVSAGMDTARINCAHDNEEVWRSMIGNIRHVARLRQRECRILMDLGGHKIRTGSVVNHKNKSGKVQKKPRRIHLNDCLVLCKESWSPDMYEDLFGIPIEAVVTCTFPDIVDQLQINETVWIDDGKIGTVIRDRRDDAVLLQVNHVGPKGARVKQEKGLNFPETVLDLPILSEKDVQDLGFVSQHADMVGLSFTERAEDVLYLHEQLKLHGADGLPIIAKIETAHSVKELPDIIARSLAANLDLGVMIARGDLATELGSVRMAEIQEEILWLCEAAHIPVIWATQVLETLAKNGVVSRAEITDAAMAVRADCVMLNKGPYIGQAVGILGEVLQRMEAHQFKKTSLLRALHW